MNRDPRVTREQVRATDEALEAEWRGTADVTVAECVDSMRLCLAKADKTEEAAARVWASGDPFEAAALRTEARHWDACAQMWADRAHRAAYPEAA